MALTLADAKQLSQDKLTNIVIDEFQTSPLLSALQFDDTVKPQGGDSLTYVYNRIKTQATAATRAINTEYVPQETITEQVAVNLSILGGAFNIDRVLAKHEKQVVNQVEFQTAQKAKAAIALFNDLVINGNTSTDENAFNGIDKMVTGTATEINTGAGNVIDLSTMEKIQANYAQFLYFLRKVEAAMDGTTDFLINSDLWTVFQTVADITKNVYYTRDELGNEIGHFGNVNLIKMGDKAGSTNPIIKTDADGITTLYAIRRGLDGVHAVSPDGSNIVSVYAPDLSTPGAVKKGEVEFISSLAVKTSKAAAALRGLKVAAGNGGGES